MSNHDIQPKKTRILILGGGFGGVYAGLRLQKKLRRDESVEMTLVNRENFFVFTPMLHEIAAGDLDPADIVNPIRSLLKRVAFLSAEVETIDLAAKTVTVSHGIDGHTQRLEYDYLVIAMGTVTNFFKLPGVEEQSMTMKSLGDAILLRNQLIAHMEEANAGAQTEEAKSLMTFVVAGGGFAGIETSAAINDFIRESLRFYPCLKEEMVRVIVVHPDAIVLPELGPDLGAYAQRKLSERGVEILTNTKVIKATSEDVTLSDGRLIKTRTLIWTAGTSPHPLVGMLPCASERGRIKVDAFLQVPGWPGVFALGDCASVPNPRTGKPQPPTAQHAVREAVLAADNLIANMRGSAKKPFDFQILGQLAAIGRRTGVAKIFGIKFSGFIAWWMWRTIYLAKLPRFEKKLRVAIDWTLDLIFAKDLVQYINTRAPSVSHDSQAEMDLRTVESHGQSPRQTSEVATSAL